MKACKTGLLALCLVGLLLAGCAAPAAPSETSSGTAAATPVTLSTPYPGAAASTPVEAYPAQETPTPVALTPEAATQPAAAGEAQSEEIVLTLDNSGQTMNLTTGQSFLLKLDESYDWTIVIADQSVVARVKNVMVVKGAQGLYKALAPGQTEFSAQGEPQCRNEKPACGKPSILFRQTIIVQ